MKRYVRLACMVAVVALTAGVAFAQATTTLEIKSGQVLAVHGNDLVYRGPEGVKSIHVPDDFRFDYSGQKLSVHELKPGMMVSAYIKTTKKPMPMTVTEIRSGQVLSTDGDNIVVRRDDGEVVKFNSKTIAEVGAILTREGLGVDPTELGAGDIITATIVTKMPPVVLTEQEIKAYAADPPKPPQRKPVVAKTEKRPTTLPKTAGPLPLVGLAGLVLLAAGAGLTVTRRRGRSVCGRSTSRGTAQGAQGAGRGRSTRFDAMPVDPSPKQFSALTR